MSKHWSDKELIDADTSLLDEADIKRREKLREKRAKQQAKEESSREKSKESKFKKLLKLNKSKSSVKGFDDINFSDLEKI